MPIPNGASAPDFDPALSQRLVADLRRRTSTEHGPCPKCQCCECADCDCALLHAERDRNLRIADQLEAASNEAAALSMQILQFHTLISAVSALKRAVSNADTTSLWMDRVQHPDPETQRLANAEQETALREVLRVLDAWASGPHKTTMPEGPASSDTAGLKLSADEYGDLRRVRAIIQRLHHREPQGWGDPLDGCLAALSKIINYSETFPEVSRE